MREIPVTEARAQLSDLVSQVAYGGETVVLTRHGKPLVALVPVAGLGEPDEATDETKARDIPTVLDLTARPGATRDDFTTAAYDRPKD